MIQNYFQNVKRFSGSSFVSPAYGWSGTRATINYNSPAAEKNSGEARKQAGKKEGGLGEGIFARLLSAEGGMGWKRWAGFNPQNPLDFAQRKFGFRPTNTTIY